MEISGVSSKAYTSAAAAAEEEDELQETQEENAAEEAKEYGLIDAVITKPQTKE